MNEKLAKQYVKNLDHGFLLIPDNSPAQHRRQLEKFQAMAQHELMYYVMHMYPDETERMGRLLLRLPALKLLTPKNMEDIFFEGMIGNIEINSIIPYMLRLETEEYTALLKGNSSQPGNSFLNFSAPDVASTMPMSMADSDQVPIMLTLTSTGFQHVINPSQDVKIFSSTWAVARFNALLLGFL